MSKKTLAVLALSLGLATVSFAQQQNTPATAPGQDQQAASASDQSSVQQVTGTVVTLANDRAEVKIESVPASASSDISAMVGQTATFTLNPMTDKPTDLKVGDRVDLWFKQDHSDHLATRIALAASGGDKSADSTGSSGSASTSQPTSDSASQASPQQPTSDTASQPAPQQPNPDSANQAPSTEAQQPSASSAGSLSTSQTSGQAEGKAQPRSSLPKTGSPLPLIGLIGLVALCAALMLRFTLKA